jgi:GTP pyrophosphokinase
MVNATDIIPHTENGQVDAATWYQRIRSDVEGDSENVIAAIELINDLPGRHQEFLEKGIELANLVLTLNMDTASIAAALLYRPVRTNSLNLSKVEEKLGSEVVDLVGAVVRMADTSLLEMSNTRMQTSESGNQVENIKRMLVSMIDDARVAVLKLAERVVALRAAKNSSAERQARIAQEAHQVFAPLANRLGVWQLKWELEDLALRYLASDVYKAIAGQLDGRRVEREAEIESIVSSMQARLADKSIVATISGRAKHIFSIWRKMRSKNVGLEEVYDVRAIRVLVPDIAGCYAALGVIHTQWQHIPSEFDDYVAVPKENGYRSIHTAVRWSDGKTLEVQIRTPEMHEESELGVCAHWSYKDGVSEELSYAQKMDWMRQVVEWHEETEERARHEQLGIELNNRVHEERIFVYTPKGHVLDLTTGATALDFAYRVHTEIGHRSRGARVDGQQVALNTPLNSGQRVEVLTIAEQQPLRAWLHHHLEYVRTARAREKISDWFRNQPAEKNLQEGRSLLENALVRVGVASQPDACLNEAATHLGYESLTDCYLALAIGDCQIVDLVSEILHLESALLTVRSSPAQLSLLDDATFQPNPAETYLIELVAKDRPGLLMDITGYLSRHNIMLVSNHGRVVSESSTALIDLELRLADLVELMRVLDGLEQIPAVLETRRRIEADVL